VNEEQLNLLREFDSPMPVASVSYNLYGQVKYFPVPGILSDAANSGLIKSVVEGEKVVNSDRVYGMDLILTDAGRTACGIKVDQPVKSRVAKSLFD